MELQGEGHKSRQKRYLVDWECRLGSLNCEKKAGRNRETQRKKDRRKGRRKERKKDRQGK